jgi:hypothetical protein
MEVCFKSITASVFAFFMFTAAFAFAGDCPLPGGKTKPEGGIVYNKDFKVVQYCDGSDWRTMLGGSVSDPDLASLTDVDDALAPADGNVLVYDSASGEWKAGAAGIGVEDDPQVGVVTNAQWCRGDGSAVQCDQAAPSFSETDPEVGTLNASSLCLSNAGATVLTCASANQIATGMIASSAVIYNKIQNVSAANRLLGRATSGAGVVEEITLGTNLSLAGTTLNAAFTEADPQVGSVANAQWCRGDGSAIQCDQAAPSFSETDPEVSTLNASSLCLSNAGATALTCATANQASTGMIANSAITYGKLQNVSSANRLLGRATAGAGAVEEITLGTNLSLAGTTLNAAFTEADPQVGTLTTAKWCVTNAGGTAVDCTANAPLTSEADPEVGTLDASSLCLSNAGATALNCATANQASTGMIANSAVSYGKIQNVSAASRLLGRGAAGAGAIEEITLGTNLSLAGTTLNAAFTESDPQVGTLTTAKWCVTNAGGTAVDCTANAPVTSEADPEVGGLSASNFCQVNGSGTAIVCSDTAGSFRTKLGLGDPATFSGSVDAVSITTTGAITSANGSISAAGNINAGGNIVAAGSLQSTAAGISVANNVSAGGLLVWAGPSAGGSAACYTGSGPYQLVRCTSLRVRKTDIKDLELGLDAVLRLRPRTFHWKDETIEEGRLSLGFIAEEVDDVDPMLAEYSGGELIGVRYMYLTALLTKAIQQLNDHSDEQAKELASLRAENEIIRSEIETLKAAMKQKR